jgi:hypothetical protein
VDQDQVGIGMGTGPFLARRQDSGVVCLWARRVVASGRQVQGYSYGVCNEQQQQAMNSSLHDGQAASAAGPSFCILSVPAAVQVLPLVCV